MRKGILWLHRWVGLTVSLLAVFSGVTGAALVFRPEIEASTDALARVSAPARAERASFQKASFQTIADNVRRAYPDNAMQHLFMARKEGLAHVAWMRDHELRVYVDPYTGAIRGERRAGEDWLDKLAELHIRLLSGDAGHNLIGWGGVGLLAMSLSGLILWWPRKGGLKNAFRFRWTPNWRGRNYELHRVGGALVAIFLCLTSLTGICLVWPELTESVLTPIFGKAGRPKVKATKTDQTLPLDTLVARADAALPGGELRRISFPSKAGAPITLRKKRPGDLHPNGMNYIYLDSATGAVLAIDDASKAGWGTRIMNARYPVHLGLWGGTFSRALMVFIGLSPLLLFVSGFLIWNVRRSKGKHSGPR